MAPAPELSVVIPAYNEEPRIGPTLARVHEYLAGRGLSSEILVVDDGSRDGTARVTAETRTPGVALRLLRNPGNRGKGYSVRHGFFAARGRTVLFSDADLSTPIEEYAALEERLRAGCAIAIGSRALPGSRILVRQPWFRETMGKGFNVIVRAVSGLPFPDTQCGFKAFDAAACRPVFLRARIDGFAFDVEILMIARRLDLRAEDVPVRWINSPASRVHPVRDSWRMFRDTVRLRLLDLRGALEREHPGSVALAASAAAEG